jgi:hypothetical protein
VNDWLEMLAWLVVVTVGSRALPPRATLCATSRLASRLSAGAPLRADGRLCERARSLAATLSTRLPVSNCLDEAIAARLWLARRGVGADVVVGMRRAGAGWDGHAWFEHDGRSYGAGDLPHRIVFRESEVSS